MNLRVILIEMVIPWDRVIYADGTLLEGEWFQGQPVRK